jgi:hypothetical protein
MRVGVAVMVGLVAIAASGVARAQDAAAPAAPAAHEASEGIMVGATVSYFSPVLGGVFSGPPALGAGPAFKVSAGYRWGSWVLGGAYQHAFLGGGTWEHESTIEQTASASSDYAGLEVIAITAPDAPLAAFFRFGAGYRFIQVQAGPGSSMAPSSAGNLDVTLLGIGAEIHAGGWLRIVPEASLEVGPFNAYSSLQVTAYFDFWRRGSTEASTSVGASPPRI